MLPGNSFNSSYVLCVIPFKPLKIHTFAPSLLYNFSIYLNPKGNQVTYECNWLLSIPFMARNGNFPYRYPFFGRSNCAARQKSVQSKSPFFKLCNTKWWQNKKLQRDMRLTGLPSYIHFILSCSIFETCNTQCFIRPVYDISTPFASTTLNTNNLPKEWKT